MPSFRGYKQGIDNQALREVIDKYTAHVITMASRAGINAMRELRTSAVSRWYQNSTAKNAMNDATKYESTVKQSNKEARITIRSYVDILAFESYKKSASDRNSVSSPYDKLKKWRDRHENGNRDASGNRKKNGGYWTYYDKNPSKENPLRDVIKMTYTIGEYLFKLPWEDGIIGLPPYAKNTNTGWINPKPIIRDESLEAFVKEDIKNKWDKRVRKEFKSLNK